MRGGRVVQYAIAGSAAWLGTLRTHMRVIAAIAPFMSEIAVSAFPEPRARAQTAARSEAVDRFAKLIGEASGRFAIPARWIRAVMRVESDGDEHAISSRGAMRLMQLMPGTWVEVSVRYGLGADPFDAHDNIIAGAAYLKYMHDRFGSAGFLAAYHAGPARYEQHLTTGRPNTRRFASDVQFLGRKHRCLSIIRKRGDRDLVCIPDAETLHRNRSPLTRSCVNHLRIYSDDRKCSLSQSAARSWKLATRELGAGDERPRRAG